MSYVCYSEAVEAGSFTIKFQEHVAMRDREVWLDRLKNRGARIELQGDHVFCVHCATRKEVRRAGFLLLWPMSRLCSVIGTAGSAEARAGAYRMTGNHLDARRQHTVEDAEPTQSTASTGSEIQ
jgi:hypothetical protein